LLEWLLEPLQARGQRVGGVFDVKNAPVAHSARGRRGVQQQRSHGQRVAATRSERREQLATHIGGDGFTDEREALFVD
jgi:hypothetical protein